MALTQSYDNELNAVKGWFSPYALDKTVNVAADSEEVLHGSVCSLNATGNLVRGLIDNAMPLFAFSALGGFTGAGPAGKMANLAGHMNGRFYGQLSSQETANDRVLCLVATGSYELETTEFVAGAYVPNDKLTSAAPNVAESGKLAVTAIGSAATICGIVSDGTATNNFGKSILRFWPVYIPHGH